MKTIKQIADELGVSKDKVKYRVRKLPPSTVNKTGEITLVTDEGIRLLQSFFEGKENAHSEESPGKITPRYIEMLEREIEAKNNQLEAQATQISVLADALVTAQQTAAAAQALHAATVQQHLTDNEQKPEAADKPPGIFARFFGKRGE